MKTLMMLTPLVPYTKSVVDGETRLLIHKGDSGVLIMERPTKNRFWKEAA